MSVPVIMITRREVTTYKGGSVSAIHSGVIIKMRMSNVVRAGRVVAEVAVRCVDKKSVNRRNGSSRMLHRNVKTFSVLRISSRLF